MVAPKQPRRGSSAGTSTRPTSTGDDQGATASGAACVVVAVRVRPLPAPEAPSLLRATPTTVTLSPGKSEHAYSFDHVFDENATQDDIYPQIGAPILRKALQGFNATIFAYGQTGSGKSYTMMGSDEQPGLVPQMSSELFFCVDRALADAPEKKFLLTASYLEIYNEVLYDLLQPAAKGGVDRDRLEIKEHSSVGVHVKGLLELPVRCQTDLLRLLRTGNARRCAMTT